MGLRPNKPQSELGTRMDPFVSVPSAIGTRPPATAAPDPPDDPAGHALEVVRIAGRAVMRVLAREVVGEFAHVERADEDGSGGFQARNRCRVRFRRRTVAIDLGAGARRQALDVEQVLDRERRARERPEVLSARTRRIDGVGFGERTLSCHVGERAERAVARFDALQGRLRDLACADRPAFDGRRDRLR